MQSFTVTGMTCGHCVRAVTDAVTRLDASATVHVDLASGQVEIDSPLPRGTLAEAITEEGYAVGPA
jgi:copper chaperone